jgi:hypothetical protein
MKALNEIEGLARLDILEQSGTPTLVIHAICGSVSRGPQELRIVLEVLFCRQYSAEQDRRIPRAGVPS